MLGIVFPWLIPVIAMGGTGLVCYLIGRTHDTYHRMKRAAVKLTPGEIELKTVISAAMRLTTRYYWDSQAYASGERQSHVMTIVDSHSGQRFTVTVQEQTINTNQLPIWEDNGEAPARESVSGQGATETEATGNQSELRGETEIAASDSDVDSGKASEA